MANWYVVPSESDIQHHGVLGQKWGVRKQKPSSGNRMPRTRLGAELRMLTSKKKKPQPTNINKGEEVNGISIKKNGNIPDEVVKKIQGKMNDPKFKKAAADVINFELESSGMKKVENLNTKKPVAISFFESPKGTTANLDYDIGGHSCTIEINAITGQVYQVSLNG